MERIDASEISTFAPLPQSNFNVLSSRIDSVNARVTNITPYIEEKTAYIGDTTCEFFKGKDGMISVSINDEQCDFDVVGETIIAKFEPLEEMATINLSIQ